MAKRELLAADFELAAVGSEWSDIGNSVATLWSHNLTNPADVNGDEHVSAGDGLLLVNAINQVIKQPETGGDLRFLDVSGDGQLNWSDFDDFTAYINFRPAIVADLDPTTTTDGLLFHHPHSDVSSNDDLGDSVLDGDSDADGSTSDPSYGAPDPDDDNGTTTGGGGDSGTGSNDAPGGTTPAPPQSGGGDTDSGGGDSGPGSGDSGMVDSGTDDTASDDGGNNDSGNGGGTSTDPGDTSNSDTGGGAGNQGGGGGGGPSQGASPCNNHVSPLQVDEGAVARLPLQVDTSCVVSYLVSWGDGSSESFAAHEQALHVYDDDTALGTPSDTFPVTVTLATINNGPQQLYTSVTVHNVAPQAEPDHVATDENTPVHIDVTLNDTEPSVRDRSNLRISALDTTGTLGSVSIQPGNRLRYDPGTHFDCLSDGETATDSFRYTIHDDDEPGKRSSATATVTIHGRQELHTLNYGAGPQAAEDGRIPATAVFNLSPAPKCGPITIQYARVDYDGPANIPSASDSDVTKASGTVTFAEGQSQATIQFIPVDDTVVEPDEWFYMTASAETNAAQRIHIVTSNAFFKIVDDEWRFVASKKTDSGTVGPTIVEAFSNFVASSLIEGAYSMASTFDPKLGQTTHSTATVRGDVSATLTRPGKPNATSGDYTNITFNCHSQTGDIWREPVRHGGPVKTSPLSATVGMNYMVNDTGTEEARVTVDLDFEFLAGGQITKTVSAGLDLRAGDQSKASSGGFIKLERQTHFDGSVQHTVGDGFSLLCKKGAS